MRMSFEDERYIRLEIAVVDAIVDLIYTIESLMTFFIPCPNKEGKILA